MGASAILGTREIRGMFFKKLEETATASWIPSISHVFDSDQSSETYRFLGQVSALEEWIGSRKKKEPNNYAVTIINRKFEASVEFSLDDMRRDKTGQIRVRIGDLASRAAVMPQKVLTALLLANGTAYDGTAFFADRSALLTGGRIDNITSDNISAPLTPTSAEHEAAIFGSIETLLSALDDEGEPMNEFAMQFAVMVPPAYWGVTQAVLRNEFTSAGVSNTLKALLESGLTIRPIVNPRMVAPVTGAGAFYVFRTDADVKPLIWQDEVKSDLDELGSGSDFEFFNHKHVYGVTRQGDAGFGEPAMAMRVDYT